MNTDKRNMYIHEVALYCQSSESLIERLLEMGILEPEISQEDNFFDSSDMEIIKRAARLEHDFGVNAEGIDIILHMRSQLSSLRREMEILKRYHNQFEHSDPDFLDAWE